MQLPMTLCMELQYYHYCNVYPVWKNAHTIVEPTAGRHACWKKHANVFVQQVSRFSRRGNHVATEAGERNTEGATAHTRVCFRRCTVLVGIVAPREAACPLLLFFLPRNQTHTTRACNRLLRTTLKSPLVLLYSQSEQGMSDATQPRDSRVQPR